VELSLNAAGWDHAHSVWQLAPCTLAVSSSQIVRIGFLIAIALEICISTSSTFRRRRKCPSTSPCPSENGQKTAHDNG